MAGDEDVMINMECSEIQQPHITTDLVPEEESLASGLGLKAAPVVPWMLLEMDPSWMLSNP